MRRDNELRKIKLHRERVIEELETLYKQAFDRISTMDLGEGAIAKLAQLLLQSRDAAITPLQKEIEKLIITRPPNQP